MERMPGMIRGFQNRRTGSTTCCSVVVDLWGATVGLGLGAVELATCSGLVVNLGCGAVIGTLGGASTGYNECRVNKGTLQAVALYLVKLALATTSAVVATGT